MTGLVRAPDAQFVYRKMRTQPTQKAKLSTDRSHPKYDISHLEKGSQHIYTIYDKDQNPKFAVAGSYRANNRHFHVDIDHGFDDTGKPLEIGDTKNKHKVPLDAITTLRRKIAKDFPGLATMSGYKVHGANQDRTIERRIRPASQKEKEIKKVIATVGLSKYHRGMETEEKPFQTISNSKNASMLTRYKGLGAETYFDKDQKHAQTSSYNSFGVLRKHLRDIQKTRPDIKTTTVTDVLKPKRTKVIYLGRHKNKGVVAFKKLDKNTYVAGRVKNDMRDYFVSTLPRDPHIITINKTMRGGKIPLKDAKSVYRRFIKHIKDTHGDKPVFRIKKNGKAKQVSESVDPEERNLRLGRLLKAKKLANKAIKMTSNLSKQSDYKTKISRISAILQHRKEKTSDTARQVGKWSRLKRAKDRLNSDPMAGKAIPAIDPENRALRVRALLNLYKRMRSAGKLAFKHQNYAKSHQFHSKSIKSKNIAMRHAFQIKNVDGNKKHAYKYKGFYTKEKYIPKTVDKTIEKSPMYNLVPKIKKGSKIDKTNRQKRLWKLAYVADQHDVANRTFWSKDNKFKYDPPRRNKIMRLKFTKADMDRPSTSHDHAIARQRAHYIIAKFMKYPHQRNKVNKALRLLGKGQALAGRGFGGDANWPLTKQGFDKNRNHE